VAERQALCPLTVNSTIKYVKIRVVASIPRIVYAAINICPL